MSRPLAELYASSPLFAANSPYVEDLYEQYLADPQSVDGRWRDYFNGLGAAPAGEVAHGPLKSALLERAAKPRVAAFAEGGGEASKKQGAVSRLIQIYANRGHLVADIDPLGLMHRPVPRVLELSYFGLSEADLDTEFFTGSRGGGVAKRMKLRDIVAQLRQIYCGRVGAEFAHVSETEERLWLQDRFQEGMLHHRFAAEEQRNLLWQLTAAEGLERYLHTKYVGQKRFSLEGGDALIPMLDDLVQQGGVRGVEEIVIGMAHRGRLNVLVNVLGKSPSAMFSEFEGAYELAKLTGSGDVKYHKGFSADLKTPGGNVHVALAFNPSHLEVVNPVVEGSVRARQERRGDAGGERVLPILIHGDAAFAGQGVVMETLQLSQARGFSTGGTVHIIVNNQVGFTTSEPRDALDALLQRRGQDDRDAGVPRQRRRPGGGGFRHAPRARLPHALPQGRGDRPRLLPPARPQRGGRALGDATGHVPGDPQARDGAAALLRAPRHGRCDRPGRGRGDAREVPAGPRGRQAAGAGIRGHDRQQVHGGLEPSPRGQLERVDHDGGAEALAALGRRMVQVPAEFTLHPRVARVIEDRRRMYAGDMPLDWGAAETLAYATLLKDGFRIRITGQDSGRGTFFHRHAVLHDQATGRRHIPLAELLDEPQRFRVTDSVLSEEAVLGFEYGYSTTSPDTLVVWEAQFGDFANGAQVIIDQFIASGEAKWGRLSGITLLLPHGYEGQGPEHSSARLERFLQLSAEYNIQVCVPSTPAQMFHMLRRQMRRALRKPLIVMTPKSLLRHKLSVSGLGELVTGRFHQLIDEVDALEPARVRRVVLCSGKVYFDLLERRRAEGIEDVAIVRVEQLYPFPSDEYGALVERYSKAREIVWCQEEPQNQGAWYQIRHRLQEQLGPTHALYYAGRAGAAAPAAGIFALHAEQQQNLVNAALRSSATEATHRDTQRLTAQGGRNSP